MGNNSFNRWYDEWFGFEQPINIEPGSNPHPATKFFGRKILWEEFAGALCGVMTRVFGLPLVELGSVSEQLMPSWITKLGDNLQLVLFLLPGGDLFNHKQFERDQ